MSKLITGLHHITAIASDAQSNLDFYAGILGLKLVKKTINFDAPDIYHLYYGDEKGSPGTLLTFFPFPDISKGRRGKGQSTTISFSIPENGMGYWLERFIKFNVEHESPQKRFNESFIAFEDWDGLSLELVANDKDQRHPFTYGNIPSEFAIKGLYSTVLCEECYEKTAEMLTSLMDHHLVDKKENRFRFSTTGKPGDFVDILCSPDALKGQNGYGIVHHVAFATPSNATQIDARHRLLRANVNATPILDRQYFHSIYFREAGDVLFEIATQTPGFAGDESLDSLGQALKLPPWQEKNRPFMEQQLPPIQFDIEKWQ